MRRLLFMTLRRARLPLLLKPKRAFFQRYFARQAGSRLGWAFPIMPVIGASKRLTERAKHRGRLYCSRESAVSDSFAPGADGDLDRIARTASGCAGPYSDLA